MLELSTAGCHIMNSTSQQQQLQQQQQQHEHLLLMLMSLLRLHMNISICRNAGDFEHPPQQVTSRCQSYASRPSPSHLPSPAALSPALAETQRTAAQHIHTLVTSQKDVMSTKS